MGRFNKYGEIIPEDSNSGQTFQRDGLRAGSQALFNPLGFITVFLSILLMLGFMMIYKAYRNMGQDADYIESFTRIESMSQDEYKHYTTQNPKFSEIYIYSNAENPR